MEATPATIAPEPECLINCSIAKSHCLLILNSDGIDEDDFSLMVYDTIG
jgi:hypothetical protein